MLVSDRRVKNGRTSCHVTLPHALSNSPSSGPGPTENSTYSNRHSQCRAIAHGVRAANAKPIKERFIIWGQSESVQVSVATPAAETVTITLPARPGGLAAVRKAHDATTLGTDIRLARAS